MRIKVTDYIAEFLVEHGVEHIFTVTGGGAMHFNDSFGHHRQLKCIYNHHEQGSSMAAESYARLTGRVAAVCVTTGPGGINALTGVYGAYVDSIPMFVLSGQVKRETSIHACPAPLRQLGDQEYDIVESAAPMTKLAVRINNPNEIRYQLEYAWFMALNGRKGPVWIDVPLDIQASFIYTEDLTGFKSENSGRRENPVYDRSYTDILLERISHARRPVILAGSGIRSGEAYKDFLDCTDALKLPVLCAWNATDLLWESNPYYAGMPGTVGTRGANFILQSADLLISLGCRMNIRMVGYAPLDFAKNAFKIVVDIDENEMRKPTVRPDIAIHADVKDVCRSLSHCVKEEVGDHSEWLKWCRDIHKRYPACLDEYEKKKKPLSQYVFTKKLSDFLGDKDVIVCGNGAACVVTFQAFEGKKGERMYTNSGSCPMGYAFPAAIGASVALGNERRITCIDGDGSLMMNLQELQVAAHHHMNIKTFLINNNGYHSIRQTQQNLFKPPLVGVSPDTGVSFPDFKKLAEAFSFKYLKIDSLTKLEEKIAEAYSIEGPVLTEVIVDDTQDFEPKLKSRLLEDGSLESPTLDDMYPFLPREEYEAVKKEAFSF
ncbi:MAG: thiamine pyrophosphate-binding protein [Lachnospiraceae bacterium]|nr:thiamine pyrophosphate-binding protein [Lachnospiraceae bacterium]